MLSASLSANAQQPIAEAALSTLKTHSAAAHSDTLLVLRDGRTLISERTDPRADPVIEVMSVTKGVVALAVLKAIDDKKIADLDVPVTNSIRRLKPKQNAPKDRQSVPPYL